MLRPVAAFVASLALAAFAQADAPKPPPAPSPPAKIADVAWLQGYWIGEGLGGTVEDVWLPVRSGVLLGAFRLTKADGTPGFYELFAIEEHEGSLQFIVKHFNPDWIGWEEKDKALRLRLRSITPTEAVFGGVVFRKVDDATLVVQLTIRQKDGSSQQPVLTYKRKAL